MIVCHIRHVSTRTGNVAQYVFRKTIHTSQQSIITQVDRLPDWNLDNFRQNAFKASIPKILTFIKEELPSACHRWFIHDGDPDNPLDQQPNISELRTSLWSEYEDTLVPLELTSSSVSTENPIFSSTFQRTDAPLGILLNYLSNSHQPQTQQSSSSPLPSPLPLPLPPASSLNQTHSIYLAQHPLSSLPLPLQRDIPPPTLITHTSKGDIYSSSLWLGKPPTYTPLHRDPNPNLLLQLAGWKRIRLFPPEIGDMVFEMVQRRLSYGNNDGGGNKRSSRVEGRIRGEEMMMGRERGMLHDAVWGDDKDLEDRNDEEEEEFSSLVKGYASEALIGPGEALFIPLGWWHSVKGVDVDDIGDGKGGGGDVGRENGTGRGVTASANWWFR